MGHLGTWFSDGIQLMVGLGDLADLFQPRWFYDSIVIRVITIT